MKWNFNFFKKSDKDYKNEAIDMMIEKAKEEELKKIIKINLYGNYEIIDIIKVDGEEYSFYHHEYSKYVARVKYSFSTNFHNIELNNMYHDIYICSEKYGSERYAYEKIMSKEGMDEFMRELSRTIRDDIIEEYKRMNLKELKNEFEKFKSSKFVFLDFEIKENDLK